MTEAKPKRQLWTVNVRPVDVPLFERMGRAAPLVSMTEADFVRQAIREKLDRLAAQFPQIDAVPQQQSATN